MKQIFARTALTLTLAMTVALPAAAQDDEPAVEEGFSLMEEGAKMLLRGLMREMEPAIADLKDLGDDMSHFSTEMGPALADLMTHIDDIRNYDTPEIMPNGDIIMRRTPDAPAYTPDVDEASPEGEIDL